MGNRESSSQMSCGSASDADFLDSSTDSSYVSYEALHRKQQLQRHQKKPSSASTASNWSRPTTPVPLPPRLQLSLVGGGSRAGGGDSVDLTPRTSLQLPDSPASSDLCSILNHHHDESNDFQRAPTSAMARCACRRSLSTGTGDQQQQQQQQSSLISTQRPRILPIVRNGRQLSEDIYWVLPPRRKHQQLDEQRLSSSSASDHSCCEPMSFCGPGCTPLELVHRVTAEVFGVTDEESYLALSLHHWDTERAARYLKVEQLFRWGVCDRQRCSRLLEMHSWKLDSVVQQLSRQRLCRSESH
ncbi:hypothetical protein BOX15_Mlig008990g1 [Macrostomum lignano]|uniref:Uncharacterized protein n=1 Tax=Macrostomum lignano TaxID=282301 RepID=A0A267EKX5_9PLAT|nr:hypothetical protein BOX15_Mlig008990g1 [Macrostomum lignano]